MVPPKQLLSTIESALLGASPPSPSQRIELMHLIRSSLSSFQSLLSFPLPNPADRSQVQSGSVRLPDSSPISLDDHDILIALKLSGDLHLNEIECVRLLVSANQEWGLTGRKPLDVLRLAAGMWYTERRDLITVLYTLFRAVVLDQGLETDIVSEIQKFLEGLIKAGLRHRLISLIKELNREEPAGVGGPESEPYLLDSRGSLVERRAVVCRERLILGHCLVLSVLVVRSNLQDLKDVFTSLKDTAAELDGCPDTVKYQITFSLLFFLIIAFVSDALGAVSDEPSNLHDASVRHEIQELVKSTGNNPMVVGFVDVIRLAWVVDIIFMHDRVASREAVSSSSSNDMGNIYYCLDVTFSNNVFQFLLDKILRTAAYQNDDEDMIFMYNAYLHKLITCFLSHPITRDKVKDAKDKAMTLLSPYRTAGSHVLLPENILDSQGATGLDPEPFISLLEFVSQVYTKEPELVSGNDVLWTFVNFAGEDHTNFQTLVAFLRMLGTLATSQEGASKVFELLQGKTFRSIGWRTLFDCLSIYEEKFKLSLQCAGGMLPEFQEGDAKALVAYLDVLQKVVENGNPTERINWFPDIEPLFKLLSYENVPPYLKGALRNAIATFLKVSPLMKDTIWSLLEQYDLPVVVGPNGGHGAQHLPKQVYDMRFELNEIEARREQYPSTISFINLLNAHIAQETDVGDRGRRFIGIFRFIYDHVFGPFPQRAYADPSEKWELVIGCLQHFQMILSMYEITEEDADIVLDRSQLSISDQSAPLQMQLPIVELMKDFMSGKTVFRNILGILLPGVNFIITECTSQIHGPLLEKAVLLSLEIIILVLEKDMILSDFWRPLYQPLDIILSQDHNQIVALLEYVRYDLRPNIQLLSIKIMTVLSSRMVGLVQILLKCNEASSLVEDYAACLELRSIEGQALEKSYDDPAVVIIQLLIDNVSRPAPNITHLLLKFDIDTSVERTTLQPKFHYSCFKVILDILEHLPRPDENAMLHEFGFQLLYELCLDPLTRGPTMDLLSSKKYQFFVKHLDTFSVAPLPKRNSNQTLRISSLHQRAWFLKLLAVELHAGDFDGSSHQEICQNILARIFGWEITVLQSDPRTALSSPLQDIGENFKRLGVNKIKALELLEVLQFKCPDTAMKYSQAGDILANPATSGKGGIYYYSERGDRLIDLAAFRDKLWQKFNFGNLQQSSYANEVELNEIRETIQQLLRWGWKYNKNLEEQAAQLHMLTGWSQIVEVSASRRLSSLKTRMEIMFQLLDASLTASASPDCSLKMALLLSQVALTCMAKLRDERFMYPSGLISDTVTCLDIISVKQSSNISVHSILLKLVMSILRHESSEALRRRQYTLLLSYFQYCRHVLDLDIPRAVLQSLLLDEQDGEDLDFLTADKEQAELARTNFSILRREAKSILDLVIKDATQGSESGKSMALYVLDALVSIDHEKFFLGQLQSRGFLRSCLSNISNVSYQDGRRSLESLQRACTLEAELALLLRISHKYGKSGAQVLFSMGALDHIASCKAINYQGSLRRVETKLRRDLTLNTDKQHMIVSPILRLVVSLTSLVDTTDFFEVNNKVVREVIDFIKGHQLLFDQLLREDLSVADELTKDQINLVVGILSKVWPYEESDEFGYFQGLFSMMCIIFSDDCEALAFSQSGRPLEKERESKLNTFRLCFSLSYYLYYLVTKKSLRLQVSDGPSDFHAHCKQQQPTLTLIGSFLNSLSRALERAAEEKSILLNKIQDINELSRQDVDEIVSMCSRQDFVSSSDNLQKRRYIAMLEMCEIVGNMDDLIAILLPLAEHLLDIMLIHFQDGYTTVISGSCGAKKLITHGEDSDLEHDISMLCENLVPTLEKLETLSEIKVGNNLKVFRRLINSLKETVLQKLAL